MKTGLMLRTAVAMACGLALCQGPAIAQQAPANGQPAAAAPAVDKAGAIAHYVAARKFFDQEKFADAGAEVDRALSMDPDLQDAKLLKLRIAPHLTDQPAVTGGGSPTAGRMDMLTLDEISKIRLAELGTDETDLRGKIPRKTLDDFWNDVIMKDDSISEADKTTASRDRFLSPTNFGLQVRKMQSEKALKYLDSVTLASDPNVMKVFKRTVQPYLLQNCVSCHGPASGRVFRVFGSLSNPTDAAAYTNFYEMSQISENGALMIDRQAPEKSLFLQYGLARSEATTPHPGNVEVSRKISPDTQSYKDMVAWVKTLVFPMPDYGVSWQVPGMGPPPAAATPPAATQKGK